MSSLSVKPGLRFGEVPFLPHHVKGTDCQCDLLLVLTLILFVNSVKPTFRYGDYCNQHPRIHHTALSQADASQICSALKNTKAKKQTTFSPSPSLSSLLRANQCPELSVYPSDEC